MPGVWSNPPVEDPRIGLEAEFSSRALSMVEHKTLGASQEIELLPPVLSRLGDNIPGLPPAGFKELR